MLPSPAALGAFSSFLPLLGVESGVSVCWENLESLVFSRNGVTTLNTLEIVVLEEDFVWGKAVFCFKCVRVSVGSPAQELRLQGVLVCRSWEQERAILLAPVCVRECVCV